MMLRCIRYIMKENQLLLKDLINKTLKNKIYKYMTATSKSVYIDELDIVNEYNYTYHKMIKMKPVDVKVNTYIDFEKKLIMKFRNLKLVIT